MPLKKSDTTDRSRAWGAAWGSTSMGEWAREESTAQEPDGGLRGQDQAGYGSKLERG